MRIEAPLLDSLLEVFNKDPCEFANYVATAAQVKVLGGEAFKKKGSQYMVLKKCGMAERVVNSCKKRGVDVITY